ncbi:MFS transporter [Pseudoclavibacter chungangensis]|uniref:MFS transporter n=1 Tax=Pseudoclavibacter chungangensis TaxID=587635 RepID=A0A7J5BNP7_9MICO|nr:MFS transporter [Pseudoclavibacter chungangensis]KAB1654044.1 MFS transporter [Pseudoclavibacter chungangensis]NYJ66048.1 MFS family permease [Pseudoclavibacter chungangensis]
MDEVIIRNKNDIIRYIDANPRTTKRIGILFAIAMTSVFADAYDFSSISIGLSSMTAELQLTPTQVGFATSAMAVGALLSSLLGGVIADRTGRYRLFVICGVLLVIAPLGIAFAQNFAVLLAFRFILGVAVGLDFPVAFSFMAELLSSETKAKWINLWQPVSSLATITGVAIALPFALQHLTEHLWRFTVGFGAVAALVALVLRLFYSEESPMWAARHQRLDKAVAVLEKAYDVKVRIEPDDAPEEPVVTTDAPGVKTLFARRFRPRTWLVSITAFTQSLQYYAVGFYIPLIAGYVFGADLVSTIVATVCAQLCALAAGMIQSALTTRLGIIRLGKIGYGIVLVALVLLGIFGVHNDKSISLLPIVLVAIMMFGHHFGPGPLSKTLAPISYPTEIRGIGSGWAETLVRVGSICGLMAFPIALATFGVSTTMFLVAVFPAIALVALFVIKWDPQRDAVDLPDDAVADQAPAPAV